MSRMMIRYRVKPDQVQRNLNLLHAYFDELQTTEPRGLAYASFLLEDGVTFVHLVDTDTGAAPFARLAAYQAFRVALDERCDESPAMTELHEVGSFRSP